MAGAMRLFMAHAVLYQDARERSASMNSTDLQGAGPLMLDGPMTPERARRPHRPYRRRRHHRGHRPP